MTIHTDSALFDGVADVLTDGCCVPIAPFEVDVLAIIACGLTLLDIAAGVVVDVASASAVASSVV